MTFEKVVIYFKNEEGEIHTVTLTTFQFHFILKHCRDLNCAFDYIDSLNAWVKAKIQEARG